MMVQVCLLAPGSMYHGLSKRNLRHKDVNIQGVLWETAGFVCTACGFVDDGYGNYVTNLKKENERLKKSLSEANVLIEVISKK